MVLDTFSLKLKGLLPVVRVAFVAAPATGYATQLGHNSYFVLFVSLCCCPVPIRLREGKASKAAAAAAAAAGKKGRGGAAAVLQPGLLKWLKQLGVDDVTLANISWAKLVQPSKKGVGGGLALLKGFWARRELASLHTAFSSVSQDPTSISPPLMSLNESLLTPSVCSACCPTPQACGGTPLPQMPPPDCCQASLPTPSAAVLPQPPPLLPRQQQQTQRTASCLLAQGRMGRQGVLWVLGSCCSWLQACA